MFNKISGRGYLFIAILIFAASNSIGTFLMMGGLMQPSNSTVSMGGFDIGRGELMTAIGAISLAISGIVSKIKLNSIPLGIFTIFRTAVGTLIFFSLTVKLYGAAHFMDVFSPIVWQWMLLYGVVIVVGGQLAWFKGLKTTNAADVSLASSISPIAGIVFAFLILGEVPTMAHYIGGSVIILGIIFNQLGAARQNSSIDPKEMESRVGFKGV